MKNKIIMATGILSAVVPCAINGTSEANNDLGVLQKTIGMNKLGKVKGVASNDVLNVRELPDADSKMVFTLKNNTQVNIVGQDSASGWYQVKYDGKVGFASNRYIEVITMETTKYKVVNEDIKIRKSASWQEEGIAVAKEGSILDVVSIKNGWAEIYYDGDICYVPADYLVKDSGNVEQKPEVETKQYKATMDINIRKSQSWQGEIIAVAKKDALLEVIEWGKDWSKVNYQGEIGYAPSSYLVKVDGSVTTPEKPPVEDAKPEEKSQIATVNTNDLNIRAGANTSYSILAKVNKGDVVLIKEKNSNGWYKVELSTGITGWCNGVYLENFREGSLPTNPPSDTNEIVKGKIATVNTNDLNVRSGDDTIYPILAKVNKGDTVLIKDKSSNGWYKVQLTNGVVGWCNGRYLENFREGSLPVNPNPPASDDVTATINKVISVAKAQIGKPYKYGASGPSSFDCSGLSYYAFKNGAGITLPRVSRDQATVGKFVSKSDLRPGDLVFFNTSGSGISHLGIYIGNDEMVHAPSSGKTVEITKITSKYWVNSYVTARRVIY